MRIRRLIPLIALMMIGCESYNYVTPQTNAILMVDEGQMKTFRPVDVDYSPAFSSRHVTDTYLLPDEMRKFDKDNAEWAVSFAPAWHRSAAWDAARWVSYGQPADSARWLVSANPTVVAIGPQPAGSAPGGIRPITINDMENQVGSVVVLDKWMTPPAGKIDAPPPGVRTMTFVRPMTLRELMQQMPWTKDR